jgi:hypothetical protein
MRVKVRAGPDGKKRGGGRVARLGPFDRECDTIERSAVSLLIDPLRYRLGSRHGRR